VYLLDSNVYIRAFTDLAFGHEFTAFHRTQLPRLVLSAVVASELLVGAATPDRERHLRRGLIEPFRARRRFHTPSWTTWERATAVDRRLRRRAALRTLLQQRSFFHDLLIAASARELGATVVTLNTVHFALIARHLDVHYVGPWPAGAV